MSMSSTVPPLVRLNTIGDFEMVDLAPKVEGRIRKLDPQVLLRKLIPRVQFFIFKHFLKFSSPYTLLYFNSILNSFLAQRNRLNNWTIHIINQGSMSWFHLLIRYISYWIQVSVLVPIFLCILHLFSWALRWFYLIYLGGLVAVSIFLLLLSRQSLISSKLWFTFNILFDS